MSPRTLITGAAGFVGSFLAEYLLDCGDAVLGCSPDGKWEKSSPEELYDRVDLVAWDLGGSNGPPVAARRQIEAFRPDCIYHLAALSVPKDCGEVEPAPRAAAVNVAGTRQVLELAASLPSRPRVLFTSSSHVYAPVPPELPKIDETAPLGPVRAYGRTKLAAETEVRRAIDRLGCDVVIARGFQHTGPRQNPRMMLPEWTRQFALGGPEPVEVYNLDTGIDLTDVRDVVRAYRLLMQRGLRGEVYNVGSGTNCRNGRVMELLHHLADPQRPVVELRPGRRQDAIADVTRLVKCTGWCATIALEATVADTFAWWQQFLGSSQEAES